MNNLLKKLSIILLLCLAITLVGGCGNSGAQNTESENSETQQIEHIDYAASVTLNMNSATAKQEVTVKTFVDGDTVHFNVPTSVMETGVLKARFIAVNTPESTGKIEEWGKKASRFTREKLENAVSIIIESDTATWDADSTGDRYLCWIWYQPAEGEAYRNLNLELLQEGLAIASASGSSIYGSKALAAINQAKAEKVNMYSGQPDPDFYYGDIIELTLQELRANTETYGGMKVAFTGVISTNDGNNSVYVESYDAENDVYYGFSVYYGFNLSAEGLEMLAVGNEVRIVGSLQYYEAGGTWQVSDLSYRVMKPDDPNNLQLISKGNSGAYVLTDAETFKNGTVEVIVNDELQTLKYAEAALSSSISMEHLKVVDIYTTTDPASSSKGAMTLTCEVDGHTISVRTSVLYDEAGNLITEDAYLGQTITVKGIVDYYNGTYQIKVFSANNIIVE